MGNDIEIRVNDDPLRSNFGESYIFVSPDVDLTDPNSLSRIWDLAQDIHSIEFQQHGVDDPVYSTSPVTVVQIERTGVNPFFSSYNISRHGESAADLMERSAEQISETDINALFMNIPVSDDALTPAQSALFMESDVVVLSYGSSPSMSESGIFSSRPFIQNSENRAEIDEFFSRSDTIIIQSAGNDGRNLGLNDVEAGEQYTVTRSPHFLRVGAADMDAEGNITVSDYSSSSAPTIVTLNPFDHGFQYEYYMTPEEARPVFLDMLMERLMLDLDLGTPILSRQGIKEQLEEYLDRLRETREELGIGADNLVGQGIEGTSFSAPNGGGIMGGIEATILNETGIELSPFEIQASAYLAAQTVSTFTAVQEDNGIVPQVPLRYENNGAGIPWNETRAGFGVVISNPEFLEEMGLQGTDADPLFHARAMAEIRETEGITSKEMTATSGVVVYDYDTALHNAENNTHAYSVPISEDGTVMRAGLELRFHYGDAPETVTLVSPSGGEIQIPLSDDTGSVVFADSNAFFGNDMQGDWQIIIPDGFELDTVNLTLHGEEPGGVISTYLDSYLQQPEVQAQHEQDIETSQAYIASSTLSTPTQ